MGPAHLFIFGGSQGARQINDVMIEALPKLDPARIQIVHQTGDADRDRVEAAYAETTLQAEVIAFERDMPSRYRWADLVLCRAGALSVSELASAGLGAILVPYPHAVDDHQARNAEQLVRAEAAVMLRQSALSPEALAGQLRTLLGDRDRLLDMARAARGLAQPDAAGSVARACLEAAR